MRTQDMVSVRAMCEWMWSLVQGLVACHEVAVLHRDIKPANCIMCMSSGEPMLELKLADFGNSVMVTEGPPVPGVSQALEWASTPSY